MSDDSPYRLPPDPLEGREHEFGDLPPREVIDLPPVEPPSAGFIVQLFLVPALIVTVVIGVYLLFGRLASGEQDWRKQLSDVRSDNPHRRWRGADGLAQMLRADATADGVRLAENRDVAQELAALLQESLNRVSTREDDYKQLEFLTRTLGLMDVPDLTFPVLISAMDPVHDREVRKNAIASLATVAYRTHEKGRPLDESTVVPEIISATEDSDAMIRHLATYSLGLFQGAASRDRLEALVQNGDELTRVNAAFALSRRGSVAGISVLEEILESQGDAVNHRSSAASHDDDADLVQDLLVDSPKLSNTLKALGELSGSLDPVARERVTRLLTPIAENHPEGQVRVDARTLLAKLSPNP
ncbi:MAG: HEAT repeat domain-containing protein [Planctomycetaceae bacterium]|nr:HEAT repeat domain-containing protein [Planctomycetaceae bacterium]